MIQKGQVRFGLKFLAFALAALCLAYALSKADLAMTAARLKDANVAWCLAIVGLSFLFYALRGWRWQWLCRDAHISTPFWPLFHANMIGYVGNSFLPARAGDAMRLVWAARTTHVKMSRLLGTIVVERILDVMAVAFVISLGSLLPGGSGLIRLAWIIGLGALLVLLAMMFLSNHILAAIGWSTKRWRPESTERAENALRPFLEAATDLRKSATLLPILLLTAAIWGCDATALIWAGHATGTGLTLQAGFLLSASLGLSAAIPSTPGYIGIYQAVAVSILSLFSIAADRALALIFLYQALAYFSICAIGTISFLAARTRRR